VLHHHKLMAQADHKRQRAQERPELRSISTSETGVMSLEEFTHQPQHINAGNKTRLFSTDSADAASTRERIAAGRPAKGCPTLRRVQ
jgi:hypothetical protein